jgi:hypothetical protein
MKEKKMKSSMFTWIVALSVCAPMAMPTQMVAQEQSARSETVRYTITDLGTLEGGTFSQPFSINRYGLVSGSSNLADGNQHATLWLEKLKVDIGAPGLGGPNSIAFGDN